MVPQVILDKARDEIVAMIVAVMSAQFERNAPFFAGCFKKLRIQFLLEKIISEPLVDENRICRNIIELPYDRCRIVFSPGRLVVPQVIAQGFFTPGATHGCTDR